MTNVDWIPCDGKVLPNDGDRVLYHRPQKLTKVGEMVYREHEKERFIYINSHWAQELTKPNIDK